MKEDETELELIRKLDELVDAGKLKDRDAVFMALGAIIAKLYKKTPVPKQTKPKPIAAPSTEDSKLIRNVIDKFLTGAIELSPYSMVRWNGGEANTEWGFGICSWEKIEGNEVCLVWQLRRDENAPRSEKDPGDVYLYVASGMYDYWDRSKAKAHCVATDDIYASMRTLKAMSEKKYYAAAASARQSEEKAFANRVERQRKLICSCLGLKEANAKYTKDATDLERQGFILSQLLTGPMMDWDNLTLEEYPGAGGSLLSFAVTTKPDPEKAPIGIGFMYQKNLHELVVTAEPYGPPPYWAGCKNSVAISMVLDQEDPWAKAMEAIIVKLSDRYAAEQRARWEQKKREEEEAKERERKEAEESIALAMKILAE